MARTKPTGKSSGLNDAAAAAAVAGEAFTAAAAAAAASATAAAKPIPAPAGDLGIILAPPELVEMRVSDKKIDLPKPISGDES